MCAAAIAAAITSFSGTLCSKASRRQSSYSGAMLTISSPNFATLTLTVRRASSLPKFRGKAQPFHFLNPDAQSGGLSQKDLQNCRQLFMVAKDGKNDGWSVLFHLGWNNPDIPYPCCQQPFHRVTCHFTRHVIQVRFNDDQSLSFKGDIVGQISENDPQNIWEGQVSLSAP